MPTDNYQALYGYKSQNGAIASPGAQTFTAPRDAYLSSVNLYFTESPQSADDGINMEIRNVTSNVPGDIYYAHSHLNYNEIQSDKTGKVATKFSFNAPVFLHGGQQYAIVLYTTSTAYQLAISVYNHLNGLNYEGNVTDNKNPNEDVGGTYCYSMDGKTWITGDPNNRIHDQGGSVVCLKFDVNTANYVTDDDIRFSVSSDNNSLPLSGRYYQTHDTKRTMNLMSYLTFLPDVYTPANTSVSWYYNFNTDDEKQAVPLNPNTTITLPPSDNNINNIYVWAHTHGTSYVSPVINRGSMHFTAQLAKIDGQAMNDESNGIQLDNINQEKPSTDPFSMQDDTKNAGEYISRNIDYKRQAESHDTTFNQIYASYEFQSDGAPRPSVYFNLNANNAKDNPYQNVWIQIPGYDEYEEGADGNEHYYTVDPFDPLNHIRQGNGAPYTKSPQAILQRTYSEQVSDGMVNSTWIRYHFHVSLHRIMQKYVAYYLDSDHNLEWFSNGYPVQNQPYLNAYNNEVRQGGKGRASNNEADKYLNNPVVNSAQAYEIEFKIILHSDSPFHHPKVRKFRATMNNDDQQNENEAQAN